MKRTCVTVAVLAMLVSAVSRGESTATLTVVGSASKTAPAKLLRVNVSATGEGKTAAEAVADLRKQTDSIKSKLADFKPVEGTLEVSPVSFGPPTDGLSPVLRRQQMMMRQMRGQAEAKPAAEEKVTSSSMLLAEYALEGGEGDEAIVKQYEKQKQIADSLKSVKKDRKLTPEEEEMMEEMAGMMEQAGPQPGVPTFAFVLPLTGDELAGVTKEAVADAQRRAAALAQAAGRKLGAIQSIQSGSVKPSDQMTSVYMAMMRGDMEKTDETTEAVSETAGPITFTANVTVVYAIE